MADFVGTVMLLVILGVGLYAMFTPTPKMHLRKKCERQPHLDCPLTVELTARGGLRADGHFKCCKIISQMKAMNKAFAHMEPGVDYNGMSITHSVSQVARNRQKQYEELDDSGPLGYNTKEPTDDN